MGREPRNRTPEPRNPGTPEPSDALVVELNGAKIVGEVSVFSMQDSYAAPIEPTPTLTFTSYGVRAFEVQYWTGTASATAG